MKNEILKSLWERKSMRVYDERDIGERERAVIIDAALQAPTAGNMTLYSIIDVRDGARKERLSVLCDNQPFIARAPMVLIFVADWQRSFDCMRLVCGETIRRPSVGDLWLAAADALIAAQNSVVAAESLGLGSCYIGDIIENVEGVRETLELPKYAMPAAMLCFGYPTQQQRDRAKPPRFSAEFVCHRDSYRSLSEDEFARMYEERSGRGFADEIEGIYRRKWSQDFMMEMTRSVELWINEFCG